MSETASNTWRDPKERFGSRVENYIRYRPGYPAEILQPLVTQCGLAPGARVADVGCGPGNLARLFVDFGCQVTGVEPNLEMRAAGERLLGDRPNFSMRAGSAEVTGLPDAGADFITAGQAFHWFDLERTRPEFSRVLAPGGWLVLVWNERSIEADPFQRAYEELLRDFSLDYDAVNHRHFSPERISAFYAPGEMRQAAFTNTQVFDYAGLEGRARSSSYVPEAGQPGYERFFTRLRAIFDQHQQAGCVAFTYDTLMYFGRL